MNKNLIKILPDKIIYSINQLFMKISENRIEEIRLRLGKPLVVHLSSTQNQTYQTSCLISKQDIDYVLEKICEGSIYAFSEQIKNGFITCEGGYRVGLVGDAITQNQAITNIKNISGLNIRIPHEIIGFADCIIDNLIDNQGKIKNTLIISPPAYGKTTLLRDIARNLSNLGNRVSIVDERSEIAGVVNGISQYDVGIHTDVLNLCPKSIGMNLLLRSMSPNVIITDEIGSNNDICEIQKIINSGVAVITSIHASSLEKVSKKIDIRFFDVKILIDKNRNLSIFE